MPILQRLLIKVLKDEYRELNVRNSSYSLRAYAKRLQLAAPELNSFLHRKRKFSVKKSLKILKNTNLETKKKDKLIDFTKSYKPKFEVYSCSKIYNKISEENFSIIKDWYYYVILCTLEINTKGITKESLSSKIEISDEELSRALIELERLDLISKDGTMYFHAGKNISIERPDNPHFLKQHHRQNIERALSAFDTCDNKTISISGTTFSIPEDKVSEAFSMIDDFRKYFACYFADHDADSVYRLNLQLFPMALKAKDKELK